MLPNGYLSLLYFSVQPTGNSKKLLLLFSGQPVLVEVSLSLRNILEIDEHRQVSESMACEIDTI